MSLSTTLVAARPPSAPLAAMMPPASHVSPRRPSHLTVLTHANKPSNITVESGDCDDSPSPHRSEHILDDDSADEDASELVMTPMPRRRAMSPVDGRHAPLSAGLVPSQMSAHRPPLPSRHILVLGAPGARINVVRDEKKALGLKAAVGNFRRRTTSNSFADQPSSVYEPSSSPECPESPVQPPSPDSDALHASSAPRSANVGGSQLEARRQALAIVTQGVGHRRISSEQIKATRARSTPPVTSSRSMPSLDQIQGWAAQRKAATARKATQTRSASLHMGTTPVRASAPIPMDCGDFANNSDAIILACEGNIRPPMALAPHTPALSPSSPGDDKETPLSTPSHDTLETNMARQPDSWLTSSAQDTCAKPALSHTRIPTIQFDPASAIQAGEDAVAFAKLLLESTPPSKLSP